MSASFNLFVSCGLGTRGSKVGVSEILVGSFTEKLKRVEMENFYKLPEG